MKTTIKIPAHPRRFTRTPRAVDADYMDCSWGELFDVATDELGGNAPDGIPYLCFRSEAFARQTMARIARYAPSMTLRRAAKGW